MTDTTAKLKSKLKKCFIITPIGDEKSEIRRHIDGIIDAALKPVIEDDFNYQIEVAHRIDAPGNIPKQVILEIFHSDLVITNLTGNNPNVMYELALRHCFGKPVIMIAEKETSLPADIIGERTIFYINDAQGVLELKANLSEMIKKIEEDLSAERLGPVYEALDANAKELNIVSWVKNGKGEVEANVLEFLIDKINDLQLELQRNSAMAKGILQPENLGETGVIKVYPIEKFPSMDVMQILKQKIKNISGVSDVRVTETLVRVSIQTRSNGRIHAIMNRVKEIFESYDIHIENIDYKDISY